MISDIKKTPKNAKIFICEKCNFKCCNKKDYTRHLNTLKHKNQQNQHKKPQKTPNEPICIYCSRTYSKMCHLRRHEKTCKKKIEINQNDKIMKKEEYSLK